MTATRLGALDRALVARRPQLDRALLWASPLLAVAALVVASTGHSLEGSAFWAIYVAPMLAAVPFWARLRLAAVERIPIAARVFDVVVFFAALLRFIEIGGIPASGHTLFLTHAFVTVRDWRWRVIAVALLAMTTWFKLALWHDVRSWIVGIAAGLATGLLSRVAERTHHPA